MSQQFPCEAYPALGVMVENAVRALAPLSEACVLAPRPYTLPLPGFPYGELARLPLRRRERQYWVHRPRYVYPVPKRLLYAQAGRLMAHSLRRYARQLERPDLIHAHWSYPDGFAARSLRDRFGCPLVVHARGTLERVVAAQSARLRELISLPLREADAVIANSDALRDDCLRLGVAAERIRVIPNGVDLALFEPADKREAQRALELNEQLTWALYCGNLREVKGVDLLADAIPQLCAAEPELGFAIVGGGELDALLRERLRPLMAAGRVVMTGALPQARVARYMQAADLLVLPSRSEARGNVVIEALACQTPVAAARVGGIPEVVSAAHGALFEPGSSDAIVTSVRSLLRDNRLRELGAAGRRFVLEGGFTWDAFARALVEVYRALLNRAGSCKVGACD